MPVEVDNKIANITRNDTLHYGNLLFVISRIISYNNFGLSVAFYDYLSSAQLKMKWQKIKIIFFVISEVMPEHRVRYVHEIA